jgi:hypothetical protein
MLNWDISRTYAGRRAAAIVGYTNGISGSNVPVTVSNLGAIQGARGKEVIGDWTIRGIVVSAHYLG